MTAARRTGEIGAPKAQQYTPDFLQINPNHHVPVLEHDGFVLWESYAIMQYLADLTPGQSVYPTDPQARADVNRWMFWCAQELMPGVAILNRENAIKPAFGLGSTDAAEVARGEKLLTAAAKVLDDHLADAQWICKSGPTLADFAIGAPLGNQEQARYPVTQFAHLQRWLKQVRSLPVWKGTAA